MSISLFIKWLQKNAITVLLVITAILLVILAALGFWLRIRGFKISDLLNDLQVASAKNQIGYLREKRAVLATKAEVKEEEIEAIEAEIKSEEKKVVLGRLEKQGMSSDEIANRLSKLGF